MHARVAEVASRKRWGEDCEARVYVLCCAVLQVIIVDEIATRDVSDPAQGCRHCRVKQTAATVPAPGGSAA